MYEEACCYLCVIVWLDTWCVMDHYLGGLVAMSSDSWVSAYCLLCAKCQFFIYIKRGIVYVHTSITVGEASSANDVTIRYDTVDYINVRPKADM